ncbi:hypothetical protein OCF43_25080 [Bacillus cereus]|nr:hypothetical protein [Bacillus cereus]
MARFEFWAKVDTETIEIPDEELVGLSDEEKRKVLLERHNKWCERNLYGDWTEIK